MRGSVNSPGFPRLMGKVVVGDPAPGLVEPGPAQPPGHGHGVAAGDLVVAEDLQELQVAQFAGPGLGQPGVEGVQHAGQLQRAQALVQGGVDDGHGLLARGR